MTKKEYERLSAYYALVKATKDRTDSLYDFLRGIKRRRTGNTMFRLWIRKEKPQRGLPTVRDRGVEVILEERIIRDHMLPALQAALEVERKNLKELPTLRVFKYD